MIGGVLALVAVLAVLAAGGSVWLLVRDGQGRRRVARARRLRRMAGTSALVVIATLAAARPWYWDVGIAVAAAVGVVAVGGMLRRLLSRPPAGAAAIAMAMASVVLAAGLVTMGGTAAALDAAALVGGAPTPADHGGRVLAHAVIYQLFWGPAWAASPPPPALGLAASFQRDLGTSTWTTAVVEGGFGVRSVTSGGCWVDPVPAPAGSRASSIVAGVLPQELRNVMARRRPVTACPDAPLENVPTALPRDALVAVWLDPSTTYALSGVSVHGVVPWPGRPDGLAVAGLSDGYATWGLSSCPEHLSCRRLPALRTPTYALSHEIVEAVTNPYGGGWYADTPVSWSARYVLEHGPPALVHPLPPFPGEVADLCESGRSAARGSALGSAGTDGHGAEVAPFDTPGKGCVG